MLKHYEQKRYINLALNKLKDDENLVTTLFYLNECSIEEIHEITGITISNIKVKLYRVRKKLYSELQLLLNNEVKSLL